MPTCTGPQRREDDRSCPAPAVGDVAEAVRGAERAPTVPALPPASPRQPRWRPLETQCSRPFENLRGGVSALTLRSLTFHC